MEIQAEFTVAVQLPPLPEVEFTSKMPLPPLAEKVHADGTISQLNGALSTTALAVPAALLPFVETTSALTGSTVPSGGA